MIWKKTEVEASEVRELARRYELDLMTAAILARRSLGSPAQVRSILEDDPRYLHNPFLMPAMADAVERISAAIESGERILVFGDRDVDGVTATVLLVEALKELGAEVHWTLPEGEEGYGLSVKAVEEAAAGGTGLVITVDCGISNQAEIARAAELGIETIVLDHHNPPADLPPAFAVVDPKLPGYPFRDLAGCAVASKLEWALRFSQGPFFGMPVCLLAARPANGAVAVDAVRLVNLVETGRAMEMLVPGMVRLGATRIAPLLAGAEVLVLDAPAQARLLARAFPEASLEIEDLGPLVREFLPELAGRSLLAIQAESRDARYRDGAPAEIDTLADLFRSLVLARERQRLEPAMRRMDLVTLGTLADLMPLVDENRILVRQGMEVLRRGERTGLRELLLKKDLLGKRISATDVAWQVAPVLNSAGRMGEPGKATRLFLAEALGEIETLVADLFELDSRRRLLGERAWQAVLAQARESFEQSGGRCVLVHDERIPRGITGIMASRLQGFFKAPSVVVSSIGDRAVGSIRAAAEGFIAGFFSRFAHHFSASGGHDFAGGFSMSREALPGFLSDYTARIGEMETPRRGEEILSIDAEVPPAYLTPDLAAVLDRFEPYGEGNPHLLFLTRGLRIAQCELIGRRELSHLKLLFDAGKNRWPAVYWNAAARFPAEFAVGDAVDVVYRLERNTWGPSENLRLNVVDLKK
jgi:single-stranded-DNA-specific exonuclease